MKYNLFIGRFQSPHKGHEAIFNKYLDEGKPICIAIRDVEPDESNPLTAEEVAHIWTLRYWNTRLVRVIIIPDISSVNYGRGVGYEVTEIKVPDTIAGISATEIRASILKEDGYWRQFVDSKIHELVEISIKKAYARLGEKQE